MAYNKLHCDEKSVKGAVYHHKTDFFDHSGMKGIAVEHDDETLRRWHRRESEGRGGAREKARFYRRRFAVGARLIKDKTKFDVCIAEKSACSYYLTSFRNFLSRHVRKDKRYTHEEPPEQMWYDPAPENADCDELVRRVLEDLPRRQRYLVEQRMHKKRCGESAAPGVDKKDKAYIQAENRRRSRLKSALDNGGLLFCAHDTVQSRTGRDRMGKAVGEIKNPIIRALVTDHFTTDAGDAGCFGGPSVDEIYARVMKAKNGDAASSVEPDEDQDADQNEDRDTETEARFLLIRGLKFISPCIEEERYAALHHLPDEQRELLEDEYFNGAHATMNAPAKLSSPRRRLFVRQALRNLKLLHRLLRRARNGGNLHDLLNDARLDAGQKEVIGLHLKQKLSLSIVASRMKLTVEKVKLCLLSIAEIVINLKR